VHGLAVGLYTMLPVADLAALLLGLAVFVASATVGTLVSAMGRRAAGGS